MAGPSARIEALLRHVGGPLPHAGSAVAVESKAGEDASGSCRGRESFRDATPLSEARPRPTHARSPASGPADLRYTVPNDVLTMEERVAYEELGFHVVRGLVGREALDAYKRRFIELCAEPSLRQGMMTVMKDVSYVTKAVDGSDVRVVNKIQNYEDDPVLFDYCKRPEIIKYAKAFTGPDIASVHTMLINKCPDAGTKTSRHPLHQDLHYFPFRPADRIVASWTAMQKVNRENGCLVVIPGTHKGELLEHGYPEWEGGVNVAYHGIKGFDGKAEWVYLDMEPGDTVFFHPLLIHGSGSNKTKGFRKAISCHYAASTCGYIPVEGTTHENIAKEVLEMAAKKGVTGISFQDIWAAKVRMVDGKPGDLTPYA